MRIHGMCEHAEFAGNDAPVSNAAERVGRFQISYPEDVHRQQRWGGLTESLLLMPPAITI